MILLYNTKSSDAKASKKCHLKFSSLMMIFIKLTELKYTSLIKKIKDSSLKKKISNGI